MRKLRVLLSLLMCLGLLGGCHRSGKPSPDYQKARTLWLDLLRDKMGKAYGDPGAQEVLDLLDRVDPSSMDARVAADLKAEIQKGRADSRESDESLRQQVERAQQAATSPTFVSSGGGYHYAVSEGDAGEGAQGDGGTSDERPTVGMSAGDFDQKFSRCFEYKTDAAVGGQLGGKTYGLRDLSVCRELYGDLQDKGVVIFDGKVAMIEPLSAFTHQKFKLVNGKLVPMDEAEEKAAAQPAPAPAPTAPVPGVPPIQTTGPGASRAQPIAPAADPSANPKTTLPITSQP